MKEFMCVLKQTDKVTKCNMWCVVAWLLLGAVCGWIGTMMLYFSVGIWCGMEVAMALGMLVVILLMYCLLTFPADFMCALAMGKTRKYLFGANYVLWLRNTLVCMLGVLGICLIRDYVYSHFVDRVVVLNDDWSVISNPLVFVTIVLCVPALIMFLGGMRLFFGIKVFWGIPMLFLLAVGLAKLEERYPEYSVLKWLGASGGESNVVTSCLMCLIVGVIMMRLAWLALRKQRVV